MKALSSGTRKNKKILKKNKKGCKVKSDIVDISSENTVTCYLRISRTLGCTTNV